VGPLECLPAEPAEAQSFHVREREGLRRTGNASKAS